MTEYSNPRLSATVPNWPSGKRRVTATFAVEVHPRHGERAIRTTTGAPKKLTYAEKVRIVDGDDGRIYIAHLTVFGSISVMRGTFDVQHEWVTDMDHDLRYLQLMELFA